jgi:hypothetical protein
MSCNLATSHLVSCHVTFHSSLTVHPFGVMSCNLSFIFDRPPIWCHVMLTFHSSLTIHPFGVMSCNLATSHLVSCHVTFHLSLTVHPFGVLSCKPFIHLWPSPHLVSCHCERSKMNERLHDMTPNGWTVKDEWKVYMTWHQMGERSKMNERLHDMTLNDWTSKMNERLHDMTLNGWTVKDEWKVYMTWHQMGGRSKMNERLHDMTPNGWTVKDEWKVTWHDTKWVNGQRWMNLSFIFDRSPI